MAETQWPKGMFLIYRTVADFFVLSIQRASASGVSMVTGSYSFYLYDALVELAFQFYGGSFEEARVSYVFGGTCSIARKKKKILVCVCICHI